MRHLSMLKSIQAFEAAARHKTYTGAAAELGVTPAAIGQHVRALEAWTGAKLFKRLLSGSQRLSLTERGESALQDFNLGLDRMAVGLKKLRRRHHSDPLIVTASHSFMTCWLIPRLPSFFEKHQDIEIRLHMNDRVVEIESGEADVGLRFGPGSWRGLETRKLMDEEIFPVCSPSLKKRLGELPIEEILRTNVLIEDTSLSHVKVFPTWDDWLTWTRPSPGPTGRRLQINSSAGVVQAALAAQGIALARRALVSRDISEGRLVRLKSDVLWSVEWNYFAVFRQNEMTCDAVNAFVSWAECEASTGTVCT